MPLSSSTSLHSLHILVCRTGPDNAQATGGLWRVSESMTKATSSPNSWTPEPCPPLSKLQVQLDMTGEMTAMSFKCFHFGKMDPRLAYFRPWTSLSPLLVSLRLQLRWGPAPSTIDTAAPGLAQLMCMLGRRPFPSKTPHEDTIVSLTPS